MEIFRSECNSGAILLTGEIPLRQKESLRGYAGRYTKYLSWGKKNRLDKYPLWTRIQVRLLSFLNRIRKVSFTPLFFKGHGPVKVKRMAPRGRACPFLLCFLSQGAGGCLLHLQVPITHGTPAGFSQQKAGCDGEARTVSLQTASGGTSVAPNALVTVVPASSRWLWRRAAVTVPRLCLSSPGASRSSSRGSLAAANLRSASLEVRHPGCEV